MTVYANLDDGKQVQFATTQGWGDVGRLIDGLDESEFPTLTHLREFGWTEELPLLKPEIASAEIDADDPAVKDVLMNLLRFVDDAEDDAVLVISNGMGPSGSDGRSPGKSPKPANRLKRLLKAKQSTNGKHLDEVGVKNKNWVTLESGTHVFIEGGKVTAGPASLTGKPINRLSSPKKPGATKPPSNLQATKPATQKPESQLKPPAVKPASKPAVKPASKPAVKPASKPESAIGQPASKPASGSGHEGKDARIPQHVPAEYSVPDGVAKSSEEVIKAVSEGSGKGDLDAIRDYTDDAYEGLNASMRTCPPDFSCLGGLHKKMLTSIENILAKSPTLKTPVAVYRGMMCKSDVADNLISTAKKCGIDGSTYSMPSLVSTSFDPSIAADFASPSMTTKAVTFHIKAKRGLYVESLSDVKGEHEFLQSSKTKYKVVGVRNDASIGNTKNINMIYLEEE